MKAGGERNWVKKKVRARKIDWKSTNGAWRAKANAHKLASWRNYWQAKKKKEKEKKEEEKKGILWFFVGASRAESSILS